jgi:hypothetical protein
MSLVERFVAASYAQAAMAASPTGSRPQGRRISWSQNMDSSQFPSPNNSPPSRPAAAIEVPDREEFGWLLGVDEPTPPHQTTVASPSAKSTSTLRDASRLVDWGRESPAALLTTPIVQPWSNATPSEENAKMARFRAGTTAPVLNGGQAHRTQDPQQTQREAQREEGGRGQVEHPWLMRGMEHMQQVIQLCPRKTVLAEIRPGSVVEKGTKLLFWRAEIYPGRAT